MHFIIIAKNRYITFYIYNKHDITKTLTQIINNMLTWLTYYFFFLY